MIAEELDSRVALRLQLAEELGHLFRIVPGVVHDIGAQQIGLVFRLPGIAQEVRPDAEADAQLRQLSQDSCVTNESAQDL